MKKKRQKGDHRRIGPSRKLGLDHIGVLDGFWENFLGTGSKDFVIPPTKISLTIAEESVMCRVLGTKQLSNPTWSGRAPWNRHSENIWTTLYIRNYRLLENEKEKLPRSCHNITEKSREKVEKKVGKKSQEKSREKDGKKVDKKAGKIVGEKKSGKYPAKNRKKSRQKVEKKRQKM